MDVEALRKQRIKDCHDAIYMKGAPHRVPHLSSFMTWKIVDAGVKFSDALDDWDLMEKINFEFEERYKFDVLREFGSRNPLKVIKGFAQSKYIVDDENSFISAKDFLLMKEGEYDIMTADRRKYNYETLLNRRYPELKDATPEQMKNIIYEFKAYIDYNNKIQQRMKDELGVPDFYGSPNIGGSALEQVLNSWRGFKGTGIDMRRCPEKIEELCQAQWETQTFPQYEKLKAEPNGPYKEFCFDTGGGGLAHTLCSPKQYEKFYWPGIKPGLDLLVEKNWTSYWFCQGSMVPFLDFFKDLEKGHLCIHIELGDIFEIRKQVPNLALAGGIPMTMLGGGTPEQCVDMTKKLIEEIGPEGGLVLSQDKMCSYPKDCTRENLTAICDFIQNYGD